MTTIWRLNIKPDAEEGVDPRRFCIDGSILGIGWSVASDAPLDKQAYFAEGKKTYEGNNGWWPAVNAIQNRMAIEDLCWTRDRDGNYYICQITGDWEYRSTRDYRDADIVNVRPCKWFPTGGVDSVPGKILNSFIPGRTVQRVNDETSSLYSKLKYNQLCGEDTYDLCIIDEKIDLFALISSEDCEDIVGIYLQEKHGYRLIPSSRRRDTVKTEFVLKTTEGKQAYVQVKQGVDINMNDYRYEPCNPCEWFLFTTNGRYTGRGHDHLYCLNPVDIRDFALANRKLMSSRVVTFIVFYESLENRKNTG